VLSYLFARELADLDFINRTSRCINLRAWLDYEPLPNERNGKVRHTDKRTGLRPLSTVVLDRKELGRFVHRPPVELDKQPPVV
jgi:hypothetical protein